MRPLVAFGYPFGGLDYARRSPNAIQVHGWTLDPDTVNPIQVHVYIDGVGRGAITANQNRPDIGRIYTSHGNNHGFDATAPGEPGRRTWCASTRSASATAGTDSWGA